MPPVEGRLSKRRHILCLLMFASLVACQMHAPDPGASETNVDISVDGTRVEYAGVDGETALDTLRELTDVEIRVTELGEFVTGVAGRSAAGGRQHWQFLVNDQTVRVGAGNYVAKPGDRITWILKTHGPLPSQPTEQDQVDKESTP